VGQGGRGAECGVSAPEGSAGPSPTDQDLERLLLSWSELPAAVRPSLADLAGGAASRGGPADGSSAS
jgi:hypothetical protein